MHKLPHQVRLRLQRLRQQPPRSKLFRRAPLRDREVGRFLQRNRQKHKCIKRQASLSCETNALSRPRIARGAKGVATAIFHRISRWNSKRGPPAVERAILLKGNRLMRRGIFRSFGVLISVTLCVLTAAFPITAQEPARPQPGVITTFAPVVEKVAPSVVTVFTTQTVSRSQAQFPFSDDALRQFFGGQLPQRQGKQTLQGLGSGVIVSPDGYILTANHVVSGAEEIMIGLGTELRKNKAKKVGTDPGTDVALLKIDEKNLPAITFADSEKARAGDIVLAVGNPFGLRQTVTMGIISAVGRGGVGIVDYENFIQTDAAINMVISGGALVDIKGELLGINTAIFSRSGGNQGVGFAIPANLARDVMQSLREKGRVVRGYIGASVQTLTPELAEAMKLKGQLAGALVGEVAPKTPSEKAGMKTGDVITAVNGKKISDARELRLMIGSMAPGSKTQVQVNREGQMKTFDVQLAEMPPGVTEEGGPEVSPEESAQPEKTTVFGGVAVADITDDIRGALNLPKDIQGAVIAEVDADSPAGKAGLREGDVIQEVNKQRVKNAKDLVGVSKQLKSNEKILMRVYSQGRSGYVALEPK
jgi:serine protease Do